MIITVSSANFFGIITSALALSVESIQVEGPNNILRLQEQKRSLPFPVKVSASFKNESFTMAFKKEQWARIASELGRLRDQQITVEFTGPDTVILAGIQMEF